MRASEFFERYVFVRRCAGCSELIGYDDRKDAFCPSCRVKFEMAKAEFCPLCSHSAIECDCMPKKMKKSGVLTLKKLVLYRSDRAGEPENRLLYFLKHNKNRRVARFVAEQLSHKVYELVRESGEKIEKFEFVYIPRTKRAVAKYGFDQSEMVLCELSAITGVPVSKLLVRKNRGSEQKILSSHKRLENAEKDINISENAEVFPDRSYILFDDIVTSGASMLRAAGLLFKAGAHRVYGLCIAMNAK
jgi:ComF family protein